SLLRALAADSPIDYQDDLAWALAELGFHVADSDPDRALAIAAEVVQIRRELVPASPAVQRPHLVRSLGSLSDRLATARRDPEALTAADEAVDIQQELVYRDPVAALPDLATSFATRGWRLEKLDRREEAVASFEKAVELRRRSAEPESLAESLATLSAHLSWMD